MNSAIRGVTDSLKSQNLLISGFCEPAIKFIMKHTISRTRLTNSHSNSQRFFGDLCSISDGSEKTIISLSARCSWTVSYTRPKNPNVGQTRSNIAFSGFRTYDTSMSTLTGCAMNGYPSHGTHSQTMIGTARTCVFAPKEWRLRTAMLVISDCYISHVLRLPWISFFFLGAVEKYRWRLTEKRE